MILDVLTCVASGLQRQKKRKCFQEDMIAAECTVPVGCTTKKAFRQGWEKNHTSGAISAHRFPSLTALNTYSPIMTDRFTDKNLVLCHILCSPPPPSSPPTKIPNSFPPVLMIRTTPRPRGWGGENYIHSHPSDLISHRIFPKKNFSRPVFPPLPHYNCISNHMRRKKRK